MHRYFWTWQMPRKAVQYTILSRGNNTSKDFITQHKPNCTLALINFIDHQNQRKFDYLKDIFIESTTKRWRFPCAYDSPKSHAVSLPTCTYKKIHILIPWPLELLVAILCLLGHLCQGGFRKKLSPSNKLIKTRTDYSLDFLSCCNLKADRAYQFCFTLTKKSNLARSSIHSRPAVVLMYWDIITKVGNFINHHMGQEISIFSIFHSILILLSHHIHCLLWDNEEIHNQYVL